MRVRRHVRRNTANRDRDVGSVVEVEAPEIVLVRLPSPLCWEMTTPGTVSRSHLDGARVGVSTSLWPTNPSDAEDAFPMRLVMRLCVLTLPISLKLPGTHGAGEGVAETTAGLALAGVAEGHGAGEAAGTETFTAARRPTSKNESTGSPSYTAERVAGCFSRKTSSL